MTEEKLLQTINKTSTDFFIIWNDTPTIKYLLKILYNNNYNFVGKNYNIHQTSADLKSEMEKDFYKRYHGNSIPIIHIFYNSINGKNEMQITTQTIAKTYPQYKNAKFNVFYA